MPETLQKSSPVITPKVLEALGGGHETVRLDGEEIDLPVNAQLWGVELTGPVEGVSNHVFLAGRTAFYLGSALKEKGIAEYKNVDLGLLVQGAILHDIIKLSSRPLEKLTPIQKKELGLPEDFREISLEADEIATKWLKQLGFPPEVYESIWAHDFPQTIINDPYWKIILLADYMTGQNLMTVKERLDDVRTRWIDEPTAKGTKLGIEPERFKLAEVNIRRVAHEIFSALNTSDTKFIEVNRLNDDSSMPKWEQFLRHQRAMGREKRTTEVLTLLEKLSLNK